MKRLTKETAFREIRFGFPVGLNTGYSMPFIDCYKLRKFNGLTVGYQICKVQFGLICGKGNLIYKQMSKNNENVLKSSEFRLQANVN